MILASPEEIISNRELTGNKAYNLARMQQAGLPVPGFVVVPHTYLQNTDDTGNIAGKITGILEGDFYAVRSSSVLEDGHSHSFAGLFQSYLYVQAGDLPEKITQVHDSSSSERVKAYMKSRGITGQPHVSVIVQKMVDASVSGVIFGVHPVTGKEGTIVVNSVYGLGEGLVSGALKADTFIVEQNAISQQIIPKEEGYFITAEGQVSRQPVRREIQSEPSLNSEQVTELATAAKKLHNLFGAPQDIEFCYDNRELYLVQSRPVTAIKANEEEYIVWDNSNIVESYPGVTTPLTFSFISKVYEAVYTQFVIFMGVPAKEALGRKDVFANMLGLLNGRVYYNLLSWYKTLAMLPGYTINAGFMEKMMGVKEKFTLKLPQKNKAVAWLRLVLMVPRTIYNLVTLEKQKKKFLQKLNAVLKEYEGKDYQQIPAEKIVADFEALEKILVNEWKAPLVNDFFTMIYFGLLQKVASPVGTNLHNDLLCGSDDIVSAEPARRISAMVQTIKSNEALNENVRNLAPEGILKELPAYPDLKKPFDEYLKKFGDRCLEELKLETKPFGQAPQKLIAIIKGHVLAGISNQAFDPQKVRQEAEEKFRKYYKNKLLKRQLAFHVLKGARRLVSNRENLRFERTRVFGLVRKMFRGIGNDFYNKNLINHPDDIFYLTKDEIFNFIKGTAVSTGLNELISVRKKEYSAFAAAPKPASRIKTTGIVYMGDFTDTAESTALTGQLTGIGCCRGIVKAKVRVVKDPTKETSLGGDILVTENTDPGWVILFPSASGILVERGSLLSHSAILSREMGLPCVVGITGLLASLKTGDVVEMNGETGIIKIISG